MSERPIPDDRADPRRADAEVDGQLDDIEQLLEEVSGSVDCGVSAAEICSDPADPQPFRFGELSAHGETTERLPIDLLDEVELELRVELGRTQMRLEDVLRLRRGSVVALDKMAGDPVDVFVNGRLIARGEVLVMNDNFCVRIIELVGV